MNLGARAGDYEASLVAVPDVVLAPGEVYTFVAIGHLGGTPPLSILPLTDS